MDDSLVREFVLEDRAAAIPISKLPYPHGLAKKAKYHFWKLVYPIYPTMRDTFVGLGVVSHEADDYTIGWIAPGRALEDFLAYLYQQGFGNNFIAWVDKGELIGLRRPDGFEYQYHLRIFKDGEVRGHYENTPESYPIKHLAGHLVEEKRDDFLGFLGEWIVPVPPSARMC